MGYIQMSKASVLWLNSIVMCHFVSAGVTFPEFPSLYGSEELGLVQETSVWSGRQGEAELLCSEVGLGSQAPLQLEHGELTAKNNTRLTSRTTGGPLHSWVDASGRDGGKCGWPALLLTSYITTSPWPQNQCWDKDNPPDLKEKSLTWLSFPGSGHHDEEMLSLVLWK